MCVPNGLEMKTLTWMWCHAVHIITRFSQQFVRHALGCLNHTLVCFTSDVASLETLGQCTCAFMKVPESFCQFIENSTIRVWLTKHSRNTCRSRNGLHLRFCQDVCRVLHPILWPIAILCECRFVESGSKLIKHCFFIALSEAWWAWWCTRRASVLPWRAPWDGPFWSRSSGLTRSRVFPHLTFVYALWESYMYRTYSKESLLSSTSSNKDTVIWEKFRTSRIIPRCQYCATFILACRWKDCMYDLLQIGY